MDELNLAARFGGDEDERMPFPARKRKRKTIPGTGMEKPTIRFEDEDENGEGVELDLDEEEEPEEDGAFADLVDRMRGASASAGRANERRKKSKLPRRGNDSLRAEFEDRE